MTTLTLADRVRNRLSGMEGGQVFHQLDRHGVDRLVGRAAKVRPMFDAIYRSQRDGKPVRL